MLLKIKEANHHLNFYDTLERDAATSPGWPKPRKGSPLYGCYIPGGPNFCDMSTLLSERELGRLTDRTNNF